jgi:hypothetical protein
MFAGAEQTGQHVVHTNGLPYAEPVLRAKFTQRVFLDRVQP